MTENKSLNLEESIKGIIQEKLEAGVIEKLVGEQLEKGVNNALDNLFRSYGDVTKIIEEQIKSVMVPYLEKYDYSDYITKLDHTLIQILEQSTADNQTLLENFKTLMSPIEDKAIKLSDLFHKWIEFVEKSVETDGLDVEIDDCVSYESVEVTLEVEHIGQRNWLHQERAVIILECEHDEEMNFAIPVYRFTDIRDEWSIDYKSAKDLTSLRTLSEFDTYIMMLNQNGVHIDIDVEHDDDYVTPSEEPEADFR